MARVSVVIPAYNAGRYICQAVDSVLAQTYPDVECIVVDDGSTDDTRERLMPYRDRIMYIHQENQGRSAARNAGISQATGDYIALLDADDYWKPSKLARQVALLGSDSSLGAVGCGAELIAEDGTFIRELRAAPDPRLPAGEEGFAQLVTLDYGIAAPLSTLVMRKSCLETIGAFDESISTMEEWDLLLRVILRWSIGCIFEPLAFYRSYGFHVPSKWAPLRPQQIYVEVVTRAFDRLDTGGRLFDLRQKAMGLAYLRGALLDYAVGNMVWGAERMERAWQCAPTLFRKQKSPFIERLAYFATYLYDAVTPLDESLAFVSLVFRNLPASLAFLSPLQYAASSLVCTIHAFDSYKRGELSSVRAIARRALTSDRTLLKNRGLLSIFAESLVGPRLMNHLRRLMRAVSATNRPAWGKG